ncbi:MAG: tRNA (N(6)-L-threonylcarbamoyladenosine(37)-C(2))-methylthiotransferase MtaB [Lachnospiraceae bacterium]|nr:tRNA (N(6)-L-threonylcarbamoyladenosine(37)-C(2))-methylthiotransferase MtaB [Lachnospiraceae bacterium]
MKSVALHNLGCKVNAYEMDYMQQMLQEKGYKIVSFDEAADIYIVNTCTVTNIADRKSRQMLHRAKKRNPNAVVVAAGCYVQTGQETLERDGTVDLAIGNNRKKDLVEILEAYLESRGGAAMGQGEAAEGMPGQEKEEQQEEAGGMRGTAVPEPKAAQPKPMTDRIDIDHAPYEEMTLRTTAEHTRAYIKIQDGCNQFCSYCVIPYARGRVRSRLEEDVLKEAGGMAEAGYREIVLTGIHISSYGLDRGASGLGRLLEKLSEVEGIGRIRLGSLEPGIVTEEFAALISALPKVCPHFHLSLQSGSDTVLRRMNRRYDTAGYLGAVERLRKYYENPAITTDVIVGFPGETEAEFAQTETFLQRVGFYEMHIFKYSRRQGTRAAAMEGQLTEAEKAVRSERLMKLEREMSRAYREEFLGKTEEVLFEELVEKSGRRYWTGHTTRYLKVAREAETEENLQNRISSGRLVSFLAEDILLAVD